METVIIGKTIYYCACPSCGRQKPMDAGQCPECGVILIRGE